MTTPEELEEPVAQVGGGTAGTVSKAAAEGEPAAGKSGRADKALGGDGGEAAGADDRRAKMERLRAEGFEPYPHIATHVPRAWVADIQGAHDPAALGAGDHEGLAYRIAGRLVARRGHAKYTFFDLRDQSGTMQVVARREEMGEEPYERMVGLDIGDIVTVEGCVYVTQRGQLALAATSCTLLAKALRPPPDRYHGMGDPGERYRHRELDLLANEQTRAMFFKRTKMIEAIHDFLREHGFTQVETPMLQTLAGGAASRPFVTHHNALDVDVYLRISVELYLNRCTVGGPGEHLRPRPGLPQRGNLPPP